MIRPRGKSLQVIVYAGIDPATGKQKYLRETTLAGQKAAERIERKLLARVDSGHTHDERATVTDLLDRWFEHKGPSLSPTTYEGYERIIEKTLKPELGRLPVEKLTAARLDALYGRLTRDGLGASAVRHVHAVMRTACVQAVKWGWIAVNPALAASPPPVRRHELEIPTVAEVAKLLAWCAELEPKTGMARDADAGVLIRLAACTGARRGELVALRWSDIDLDGAELQIARAHVAVKGRVVEKSTKGGKPRSVSLDDGTITLLRAHRIREAEKALKFGIPFEAHAPVLTALPGRAWYPDTATHRYDVARDATGVHTRLHDLRHFHISRMLELGEPVVDVAQRVGHASTKMTLDVYGHKIKGRGRATASAVAALIDG